MHTADIEPTASVEHIYNNYPTAPSVHYIFCIYYHYVLVQIAILNLFVVYLYLNWLINNINIILLLFIFVMY